jgi:hypothetical protein
MENYKTPPPDKDPKLWEIARKRAGFKSHLTSYIIVNAFLWAIWFFTNNKNEEGSWPWPVWSTLGWGVGLAFHFFGAYVFPEANSTEREYDRLKRKQGQ